MLISLVRIAFAAPVDIGQTFGPAKYFGSTSSLINVLLPNVLTVAGVIAFIGVVIAGFNVIQHAGNGEGEKASKDQGAFAAALTGLIIIFCAYFVLKLVSVLVGYDFLNPKF